MGELPDDRETLAVIVCVRRLPGEEREHDGGITEKLRRIGEEQDEGDS